MAPSGARSRAKKLSHHQVQHEMRRSYNETENDESPFLKLPGEIRNEIYELAIPRDIIFDINDSKEDTYIEDVGSNIIHRRCEIRKRESYKRHFGITQVCRRVRKETLPVVYGDNTFMWEVGRGKDVFYRNWKYRGKKNMNVIAESWVLSRPVEALRHMSRIILRLRGSKYVGIGNGSTASFDLGALTCKFVGLEEFDLCFYCAFEGMVMSDCGGCQENARKKQNFEKAMDSVRDMSTDEPAAKLLKLIQVFDKTMAQFETPSPAQHLEMQRLQRQLENEKSPLLKLPAEIRNEIYELCVPHGEVFNTGSTRDIDIEGVEEDTISCATSIRSPKDYKRYFAMTQVCRQLRKETIKMCYRNNIFMLRVFAAANEPWLSSSQRNQAERWLKTRDSAALPALSQIILQLWNPHDYFVGMDMVLFEPTLKTHKIISWADIEDCEYEWHSDSYAPRRDCERCYQDFGRLRSFGRMLEEARKEVKEIGSKKSPGEKLLKLIEIFRSDLREEQWWWRQYA
ncbi:hypothetical protein PRZ48_009501 [Zasmidium cellare]|uniref:F-box domain-containing protein n=1 Tax=Zasmidium cellare TaxID=395010 RepID=A0ABR0ECW3_ZASCE|nr:hypothetical protein PRZ48_009501 [Zasmidium cellare]